MACMFIDFVSELVAFSKLLNLLEMMVISILYIILELFDKLDPHGEHSAEDSSL